MELAQQHDGVIVVGTEEERKMILTTHTIPASDVVVFHTRNKLLNIKRPLFLDNADAFLQRFFGGRLRAVTITKAQTQD